MTKSGLRIFALLAVLAVPSTSFAQGGTANDGKLRAGQAMVKARDYDKAAAYFARLHASTNDARALYWMGRAHQEGGRNADALRAYKRYLKDAPPTVTEPRSIDVLGHVQTLSMQVATVAVTANEGATITVDDVEVGKAPLAEGVYVDPGKHTISAIIEGRTTAKQLDFEPEARSSVDLREAAKSKAAPVEPVKAPAAAVAPTPEAPPSNAQLITIGGLGAATLLAAGSVFFSIKAAGTSSDFDAKKGELGVSRAELDGLQNDARLQAGVALGLGLAAIGAAGVTLFVLKPRAEAGASSRVLVTGQGFALAGSF